MKYSLGFLLALLHTLLLQAQFQEEQILWNSENYVNGEVVLAADFNGDLKPDYLFNSLPPDPDFVVLSSNIGYGEPKYFDSSYNFQNAVVGDYQNDGDKDLLFTSSSLLFVAENNGVGEFSLKYYPLPVDAHGVYDMDGDGKLDLIGSSEPNLWYRNLGNFENFESVEHNCPVNFDRVLLQSDLNGDGYDDWIVRAGPQGKKGHLFIGYGNEQEIPTWDELTSMVEGGSLHRVTLHLQDVDSDGDLDIWLNINYDFLGCSEIYVLRNNGTRMSHPVLVFEPSGFFFCITRPITEVSDVDGDGDPDLLMQRGTNDKLMSLINDGTGNLDSGPDIDKDIDTYRLVNYRSDNMESKELLLSTDGPITKSFRVAQEELQEKFVIINKPLGNIHCLSFADLNNDQKKDIINFDPNSNRIYALLAQNPFGYGQAQLITEITADEVYALEIANNGATALVAYQQNSLFLYPGPDYDEIKGVAMATELILPDSGENLQAIDVDHDGQEEYRLGYRLISQGPELHSLDSLHSDESCVQALQLIDFNGDRSFDLLEECADSTVVSITLLGVDDEHSQNYLAIDYAREDSIVAAYIDSDRMADLVHYDHSDGEIRILLQRESDWILSDSIFVGDNIGLGMLALQLNQDGLSDIAVFSKPALNAVWQLSYWINEGNGQFGQSILLKESSNRASIYRQDLDSDGLDDIVYKSKDGTYLSYFLNIASPISQEENGTVKVYPNPADQHLFLPLLNEDAVAEYEIFDLSGRLLQAGYSRSLIDVSDLQEGLYLIHWQINGRVYRAKFSK